MASKEAQEDYLGNLPEWKTAEGIAVEVPYREDENAIISDIIGGLRSGMTYGGSENLRELQRKLNFMTISTSAQIENLPHKALASKNSIF
jgi:IMP dehydrogenase